MGKPSGLAKEQRLALARLTPVVGGGAFYLAGGSAIGWHLHHRRSNDLDLFSNSDRLLLGSLSRRLTRTLPEAEVVSRTEVMLRLRLGRVPIDIVRYPYPLLEPPGPGPEGFPVASIRDLAAMKMATIAGRGLRRDFWDLHEILRRDLTIVAAADAYRQRFGLAESELYHLTRSLTWFEDAEKEETYPAGLTPARWTAIKSYFRRTAPALLEPE